MEIEITRDHPTEKMCFEQRPEGDGGVTHVNIWEAVFRAEGKATASTGGGRLLGVHGLVKGQCDLSGTSEVVRYRRYGHKVGNWGAADCISPWWCL